VQPPACLSLFAGQWAAIKGSAVSDNITAVSCVGNVFNWGGLYHLRWWLDPHVTTLCQPQKAKQSIPAKLSPSAQDVEARRQEAITSCC
jgi:hypothetical protein